MGSLLRPCASISLAWALACSEIVTLPSMRAVSSTRSALLSMRTVVVAVATERLEGH